LVSFHFSFSICAGKTPSWDERAGKGDKDAQWVEQAGKGKKDAIMSRTSWEGWQAESRTPRTIDPERAPLRFNLQLPEFLV